MSVSLFLNLSFPVYNEGNFKKYMENGIKRLSLLWCKIKKKKICACDRSSKSSGKMHIVKRAFMNLKILLLQNKYLLIPFSTNFLKSPPEIRTRVPSALKILFSICQQLEPTPQPSPWGYRGGGGLLGSGTVKTKVGRSWQGDPRLGVKSPASSAPCRTLSVLQGPESQHRDGGPGQPG